MRYLVYFLSLIMINNSFAKTCNEDLSELIALKITAKQADAVMSAKSVIDPSSGLSKLRTHLKERVDAGELKADEVAAFFSVSEKVQKKLNDELYGEDAVKCVETFSTPAVKALMDMVSPLAKAEDPNDVFKRLVKSSQRSFGDNEIRAKKRICLLSGVGEKCQIFGKAVASKCR